jgi:hypothetical protein
MFNVTGAGVLDMSCVTSPSKRVLIVKHDGEYSSASELDEDTLALLAADHAGSEGCPEEHINAGEAGRVRPGAVYIT